MYKAILKKDPTSGKNVPLSREEYLSIDEWYVVDPTTLRTVLNAFCKQQPDVCKDIFQLNK